MERRLLLAIVLTFVVLTAYQWLMPSPPPAPTKPPATADAKAPAAQQASPGAEPAPAVTTPPPVPAVETVRADTAERSITVDNGAVRAVFTNRGATLVSWELANYRGPDGKPVDLVPHDLPPNQPKPFSLELDDATKVGAREHGVLHDDGGRNGRCENPRL